MDSCRYIEWVQFPVVLRFSCPSPPSSIDVSVSGIPLRTSGNYRFSLPSPFTVNGGSVGCTVAVASSPSGADTAMIQIKAFVEG